MLGKTYILSLLFFSSLIGYGQLYLPQSDYYINEVDRILITDSVTSNFYNSHLSIRPILDKRTATKVLYQSDGKFYYWITQKLFKENFIIFKGEGFWCSIDPIIDLEMGSDLALDSLQRMYWNTRGLRVQAKFLEKIAFTSSFYENQAIVPFYQANYFDNHGEFFPNGDTTKYIQNNATVPGYSRTKPFKQKNGYDFTNAEGTLSYVPNKFVNIQLGNGNQFIGNGYRSLLLSDYSSNYPFGKIETNLFNGRVQYNIIYAVHQNLYRIIEYTTPEATFERKIGTYHYLDIAINKNIEIGLFEGTHWKRSDSLGTVSTNPLFLNPIIGGNTLIKGFEAKGFYAILGLNLTARIGKQRLYSQLVVDKAKIAGFQIGIKTYNLLTPQLDVGVEYNQVKLNTYLSGEKRYNYSHYNLPLAHPFVAGFNELLINVSYQYKRFFVKNQLTYAKRIQNDSTAVGNNILQPKRNAPTSFNQNVFTLYNQLEIGYRFNKHYNLEAVLGHLYRNKTQPTPNPVTNYTYIGIRTRLKNKTLNF